MDTPPTVPPMPDSVLDLVPLSDPRACTDVTALRDAPPERASFLRLPSGSLTLDARPQAVVGGEWVEYVRADFFDALRERCLDYRRRLRSLIGACLRDAGSVGSHPEQYAAVLETLPEGHRYYVEVYVADQRLHAAAEREQRETTEAIARTLRDALQNASGLLDTPIARRRMGADPMYQETIATLRAGLEMARALDPVPADAAAGNTPAS